MRQEKPRWENGRWRSKQRKTPIPKVPSRLKRQNLPEQVRKVNCVRPKTSVSLQEGNILRCREYTAPRIDESALARGGISDLTTLGPVQDVESRSCLQVWRDRSKGRFLRCRIDSNLHGSNIQRNRTVCGIKKK